MKYVQAAPGSSDFRDSLLRIAALDGLLRARGGQARAIIRTLETDPDPAVAAAAKAQRPQSE